jgi:hypothetical protein
MLPQFSGSKNKPSKKQMWKLCLPPAFTLVSYSAYSWTWRWRWYVPPKRCLTFNRLHSIISQKTELYTQICWYCCCPSSHLNNNIIQQFLDFRDTHGEQYATGGQPILILFYSLSDMVVCWVLRWEQHYCHTWLSYELMILTTLMPFRMDSFSFFLQLYWMALDILENALGFRSFRLNCCGTFMLSSKH